MSRKLFDNEALYHTAYFPPVFQLILHGKRSYMTVEAPPPSPLPHNGRKQGQISPSLCHALWMILLRNTDTLFSMAPPQGLYHMTFTQGGGGGILQIFWSLRPNKTYKTSLYKKCIKFLLFKLFKL